MPESKVNYAQWGTFALALLALILSIYGLATQPDVEKSVGVASSLTGATLTTSTLAGTTTVSGNVNMASAKNLSVDAGNFLLDGTGNVAYVGAGAAGGTAVFGNTTAGTGAITTYGSITSAAITSTGNSQVAELNVTGAATSYAILCAKANGGIGQCSAAADVVAAGNCTCG